MIGERSAIKSNAAINADLKSRNAKDNQSGVPAKQSYTFQGPMTALSRSPEPVSLARLESEERDDFSQEMGTILSESNEVTKQLMNADA